MEVLFFAELKDITKNDRESFNLSELRLSALLNSLFNKYPSLKDFIWDNHSDKLKDLISIVINMISVKSDNFNEISLSDGDKIAFLTPISGG